MQIHIAEHHDDNRSTHNNTIVAERLKTVFCEEIDKEFPATSEDSYEANLKSYLNDIFLSTLSPYLTATLDSSKLGDGENPYADLQKEQEEREQENTETFTPSGSEGGKPEDVVIYNP